MAPFILVFRPHQRPAWAEAVGSEEELVDGWLNGQYVRSCHAEPPRDDDDDDI